MKSEPSEIKSRNIEPKRNNRIRIILVGIVFIFCIACACLLAFSEIVNPTNGTPTTTSNISTSIVQTAIFILPTVAVTSTNLPTLTKPPTGIPSTTPTVTNTVIFILPAITTTSTLIFILPTNPPAGGSTCSCSGNTYNCSDFSSHSSAQACFTYCVQQGAGDIHKLDRDNDGLACENN